MVTISGCSGLKKNGQPCRAPKLRDSEFCSGLADPVFRIEVEVVATMP